MPRLLERPSSLRLPALSQNLKRSLTTLVVMAQACSLAPIAHASQALASPIDSPVAPRWVVLPLAVLSLLVIALHWVQLAKAQMPAARKRLRTACGLVMMISVPVFAYAFAIASPARPREFVLSWILASSLLLIILLLAAADLFITAAEARREHRRLIREVLTRN
jgi:hypothetical protein